MHEFSTAQQLVKAVLDVAQNHKAKKVVQVDVEIGGLTHLSKDQLLFSFSILKKDTLMDRAHIKITYLPVILRCKKCGFENKVKVDPSEIYGAIVDFNCSNCGNREAKIDGDTSCIIKAIKVKA
ncbi:hydrogenase maturation nickel metallochaperone HypA [[Eubacterium] cellulosolvens]